MEKKYFIKKEHYNKKIFVVIFAFVMLIGATACENKNKQIASEQDIIEQQIEKENFIENNDIDSANETVDKELEIPQNMTDEVKAIDMEGGTESNILIAYFSRVGNMDFDKNIDAVTSASVNMNGNNVYGNAQLLAEVAQEITGGDIFFIETAKKYPAEYHETTNQAKTEQNNDERPELLSHVENMDTYDTVILIYPNWWGTLPQPVFTFLEEYDFSGKTILPLCTHEGSRLGRSESDIEAICSDVQLLEGLSVRGSDVNNAKVEIEEWINRSEILK